MCTCYRLTLRDLSTAQSPKNGSGKSIGGFQGWYGSLHRRGGSHVVIPAMISLPQWSEQASTYQLPAVRNQYFSCYGGAMTEGSQI